MKSWFFRLFAAFLLILQIPLAAEAGRNDTYPTPLTCYVRSNGRVTTYVENNRSRVSGYISGNVDVVQLMNIYPSDGWIYGNYPTSRGKKYAWWRIEDIVSNVNFANYEARVNGKTDVYAKSDRRKYFGYVAATDKIIVVSEEGNMAQVIYPISGGYKMGWIDKNRIVRSSTPNNNNNRNITPAVNYPTGKTVTPADGWYRISPAHRPEKSLDIVDGATGNGANLQIWDWVPTQHQKFYLQNRGNGYYTIKSGHCEMYVDAQGGVPQNGENVWQYQYNGTAAQFWRFIDAGNGTVYIETKMQPGLSFDCAGGGRNNGTNVQLWTRGNVAWNKWILTSLSEGYYHPLGNNSFKFRGANSANAGKNHDYSIAEGTPVYAICDGTAQFYQVIGVYRGKQGLVSYGNYIQLKGGNIEARYGHLSKFNGVSGSYPNTQAYGSSYRNVTNYKKLLVGTRAVKKGEIIGYVGTTGNSSGSHLHFEIWENGTRKEPNSFF